MYTETTQVTSLYTSLINVTSLQANSICPSNHHNINININYLEARPKYNNIVFFIHDFSQESFQNSSEKSGNSGQPLVEQSPGVKVIKLNANASKSNSEQH